MRRSKASPIARLLVIGCFLGAAPQIGAVTIFSNTEAATITFAILPGAADATGDLQPITAASSASVTSLGASSDADGEATVLGPVKARAHVDSAGIDGLSVASGAAGWTATLTTSGIDPGVPVPLDITIALDGNLGFTNTGGDYGLLGFPPSASVVLGVSFFTDSGATEIPVFGEDATLLGGPLPTDSPLLVISAGWGPGDVSMDPGCDAGSCSVTVNALVDLDGVLDVAFGEVFDLFVILTTAASSFGGDVDLSSEFFNSAGFTISSPLSGVSIDLIPAAGAVPEPASAGMLVLGIVVLVRCRCLAG